MSKAPERGTVVALEGQLDLQRVRHDPEVCGHEYLIGLATRNKGASSVANVERYLELLNGRHVKVTIEWANRADDLATPSAQPSEPAIDDIRSRQESRRKLFAQHREFDLQTVIWDIDRLLALATLAQPSSAETSYNAVCPVCDSQFGFSEPDSLEALYATWEKSIRREMREREKIVQPSVWDEAVLATKHVRENARLTVPVELLAESKRPAFIAGVEAMYYEIIAELERRKARS